VIYGLKDAKQRKGLEKKCRKHGACVRLVWVQSTLQPVCRDNSCAAATELQPPTQARLRAFRSSKTRPGPKAGSNLSPCTSITSTRGRQRPG
jgi:hypothetical protein